MFCKVFADILLTPLCSVHDLIVISADIFMSLHNLTNMAGASVPFEVLKRKNYTVEKLKK